MRHFQQFMFRLCCDSELFTQIVAVVWLNRYRMLCLQTALASEKSTAVSRSLVVACVPPIRRRAFGLSPHRPAVRAFPLPKVRMSSRRMTAQLDLDRQICAQNYCTWLAVGVWLDPGQSEQLDRPHLFRYLGGADSRASHKSCGDGADERSASASSVLIIFKYRFWTRLPLVLLPCLPGLLSKATCK